MKDYIDTATRKRIDQLFGRQPAAFYEGLEVIVHWVVSDTEFGIETRPARIRQGANKLLHQTEKYIAALQKTSIHLQCRLDNLDLFSFEERDPFHSIVKGTIDACSELQARATALLAECGPDDGGRTRGPSPENRLNKKLRDYFLKLTKTKQDRQNRDICILEILSKLHM